MRSYETIFVLNTNMEAEQTKALVEKFKQVIVDNNGEIVKVDEWGKRRLAYEVEKQRDGYYVLVEFNAGPELASELERNYRITDGVLKYLVIKLEEPKKAKVKEEAKVEEVKAEEVSEAEVSAE